MRLAWFTPLSDRSDIGAHSHCIVEALPQDTRSESCLFVNENPRGVTYRSSLPIIPLSDGFDDSILSIFDHVILNIGNNQENHYHINKLALQRPSVVVVHDIVMQHFLAWLLFEEQRSPERYAELMVSHYGDKALEILESSRLLQSGRTPRYAPWDSVHSVSYPLLEPFVEKCQAAVVHSEFAERIVRTMTDMPIIRLFLPFDKKPIPAPIVQEEKRTVDFVSIGHIGRGKFLHLAISAINNSALLGAQARFWIVGMPNDRQYVTELEQQVEALGLSKSVVFEFGVSEARLVEIKASADVFINIRYPNTESASGSLTEQMACAKPVIVLDSGCYSEVPDDCVVKIGSLDDAGELTAAMEALVQDAAHRQSVGEAARRYIEVRSAAAYGEGLTDALSVLPPDTTRRSRLSIGTGHWLVAPGGPRPSAEVWSRLGPSQCARLLFLVLRSDMPPQSARDMVASLLRLVDQPARANVVLRYLTMKRMMRDGEPFLPTDFDEGCDGIVAALTLAIDPADFARLLYAVVLGRPGAPNEVAAYTSRLNDFKHAEAIVLEFFNSEEFTWRRMRPELATRLSNILRSAGELLNSQRNTAPTLLDRITFSDTSDEGRVYLTGEWHRGELEGVWSKSTDAGLRFRMPFTPRPEDSLILAARVTGTEHTGPRPCRISVNGVDVLSHSFSDNERILLRIPMLDLHEEDIVSVQITTDAVVRLSDFGGADDRELGVFLYELFVERR